MSIKTFRFQEPVFKEECSQLSRAFFSELRDKVLSLRKGHVTQLISKRILSLDHVDMFRVIHQMVPSNRVGICFRTAILGELHRLRTKQTNNSMLFVLTLIKVYERFCQLSIKDRDSYEQYLKSSLEEMSSTTRHATLDTLNFYLSQLITDSDLLALTKEAISLAGSDGQIFLEKTLNDETTLELITSYNFSIHVNEGFLLTTKLKKWNKNDVTVFVIDGIIERVSEINRCHLFTLYKESTMS